ncbi:MAG: hypothetical protein DRJ64_08190, partial [Thermoprotei archaeon]
MLYGEASTGKTLTLRLFTKYLYGTIERTGDDFRSEFRMISLCRATTFPQLIDEVGAALPSYAIETIKHKCTGGKEGIRGKRNQKIECYPLRSPFAMTANEWVWASKPLENRLIALKTTAHISNLPENEFIGLYNKIVKSKQLLGLELLKPVIDEKIDILDLVLKEIEHVASKINHITQDSRKLTTYALLSTGLKLWIALFEKYGLDTAPLRELLENMDEIVASIENERFLDRKELIDPFLTWLSENNLRISSSRKGKYHLVTTTDLGDYNKWAKERGYTIFPSLREFGAAVAEILNKPLSEVYKTWRSGADTFKAVGMPENLLSSSHLNPDVEINECDVDSNKSQNSLNGKEESDLEVDFDFNDD